ncbi:MAG: FmdB family transcriptional regulator [Solirubrobacterales bacterium]|nr:FmdB family transcriptional regulator [Solirubrobacterales bacterium]
MPIYEYRCRNGHDFEVFQSMSDAPVETCEVCGEPVERVFSPVAVHYKGSGFYTTDYARKGASGSGDGNGAKKSGDGDSKSDSGSSSSDSKSESGSKKSESGTASKSKGSSSD